MTQLDVHVDSLRVPVKNRPVIHTAEVPAPPTSPPPRTPRTISELISVRAQTSAQQPILGYPTDGVDYVEYNYGQINDFTNAGVQYLAPLLPLRLDSDSPERVVAVLGPSSLDYFVTVLALTRLGFTVLFLSTRISEAAYVSLLDSTKCINICVDASLRKVIGAVKTQIPELNVLDVLTKEQFRAPSIHHVPLPYQSLDLDKENGKTSWIIHSSGSTGLPKPIYQTHGAALRNYENNMNMEGFITLPLFHAHGLSSVLRGFTSHKKIFMYNASIPLTSHNLLEIGRRYSFEIFYGVPYALKLLSESEEGIAMLSQMRVVMFGGSACPDSLGDLLVEHGVNLISHYGTTETGQLMTSFRPAGDKAWNYVRVHEKLEPYARFEERGGGLYELCILEGWPSKVATNRDDGSYATKDAFVPHQTIKGAWKYACRLDDTLVLINGEKAIPIAMEMAIRHSPLVQDAVVFGSGRPRLGMMIVRSEAASHLTDNEVIDRLWSTIEKENAKSPAYAQIAHETICVLAARTPYPQTDKGTLIRQAFYRQFADRITAMYNSLDAPATGTLVPEELELKHYLRKQILQLASGIEDEEVTDNTDIFSLGIDSLQSSRLRNALLRDLQFNGHDVPQNIVFEQPSIEKLAATIIRLREGTSADSVDVEDEMEKLILKYSKFPKHRPESPASKNRVVVVTGATGSLGAHIVAQLATLPHVSEVCCLVRASSQENAMSRVLVSLGDRALLHQLSSKARRKITAYPSDFAQDNLGLDTDVYAHLQHGITTLIHCAWAVNFNKRLSSFETECIAGARNLMLLCLSAHGSRPASFNFCSSVSTVARTPGVVVKEGLPPLSSAQGMGYAQSKSITEHIVARGAEQTGMSARVLRIGQIVADRTHGIWNDKEAIPLMLQAATTFGALPTLEERPRWLPVDVVASIVSDISLSDSSDTFFNVVNPNTFSWTNDLLPNLKNAGLTFEEVDQHRWVQLLRTSNENVKENPTYKLLQFFASKYGSAIADTKPGLEYEMRNVQAISPMLRDCPALTQDLVNKFVKHFLATSWNL